MPEPIPPVTAPIAEAAGSEIDPADIRLAAMNLLARREHSVRELRNKLKRRFPAEAMIDEQLSRLTAEHLQSDARFAESYAHQRIGRGYGPVRLCEELRERGVSDADVELALEELAVDWPGLALELMRKKFGSSAPGDFREKARRARFLQYRGFTTEHFKQLLQD